mmetsp:Transcript_21664/g.51386  ORF Transcript_21664/g.51386 Transcript_21664/m.51386 type:complete len:326 (+) Transcript_21664:42-1019(+)
MCVPHRDTSHLHQVQLQDSGGGGATPSSPAIDPSLKSRRVRFPYGPAPQPSASGCLLAEGLDELVDHAGVGEGRDIAELGLVHALAAGGDLAQDAAHDLARARLRQGGRPLDDVGRGEGADLGAAHHDERLLELVGPLDALVGRHVDVDALALDGVREAHHRRLGDVGVQHDGRLDLGGADAVAGHVDDVVDAARDPVVAVGVAARAVARQVEAVDGEVGLHLALVVAEHLADRRGPRGLDGEEPLGLALEHLALLRDQRGLHAEEGQRRAAGLHAPAGDGQRRDHDAARLGLPPRVDDRAAALAHDVVVPAPRLGVDRLADRAE